MTPDPIRGGDPSREQEKGGLETPEQVIAQSEAMLKKAAEEGVEDYSLVILDAVYEGYRRNLEALKRVTPEEKKAWETEALNATYPRGWLIWNDAQGSDLSDEDNEIARIIAKRAIEVENEQVERIKKGKKELDYNTAYYQEASLLIEASKILYSDVATLPVEYLKLAKEKAASGEAGLDGLQELIVLLLDMHSEIKSKGTDHIAKIHKELGALRTEMRDRISMNKQSERYSNEGAYRDCDNTSRYSAVGMMNVPIIVPSPDLRGAVKKFIEDQPGLLEDIQKILPGGKIKPDIRRIYGVDTTNALVDAYPDLFQK